MGLRTVECAAMYIYMNAFYFTDVNEIFCKERTFLWSFILNPLVFNKLFTCRVYVAVGLRLSHHLNFSNELLMRGQLLMEIRKTFIEELYGGKVCYLVML